MVSNSELKQNLGTLNCGFHPQNMRRAYECVDMFSYANVCVYKKVLSQNSQKIGAQLAHIGKTSGTVVGSDLAQGSCTVAQCLPLDSHRSEQSHV